MIAFTFYAGMNAQLTLAQLALCYLGTVTVIVLAEVWKSRAEQQASLPGDIGRGIKWGSLLFVIGFSWGATCGYIMMWMARWGAGLTVFG